jgi:hypothetical protein
MKELVWLITIVQYGIAIFYEVKACVGGNWFGFDLKSAVSLMVANTFLIIYLQLKGE